MTDPVDIDPRVRIGHVHLKVADLERALRFYAGVLGFRVTQRMGDSAAFVSAGGYHHHIGLNTWESLGAPPAPSHAAGLYHLAILYPTRAALASALRSVLKSGIPLDGASYHGVSEAIYIRDPDGISVETVLGPAGGRVAAPCGRGAGHVHAAAGRGGSAGRGARAGARPCKKCRFKT